MRHTDTHTRAVPQRTDWTPARPWIDCEKSLLPKAGGTLETVCGWSTPQFLRLRAEQHRREKRRRLRRNSGPEVGPVTAPADAGAQTVPQHSAAYSLPARRAGAMVSDNSHLSRARQQPRTTLTSNPSCKTPARPPWRQRMTERPAPCACAQSLRAACLRLKWPSPGCECCERGGNGWGGRVASC